MAGSASGETIKRILTAIVLIGALLTVTSQAPILGLLLAPFFPLPILYYRVLMGRNLSAILLAASVIGPAAFMGIHVGFCMLSGLLLIGFVLGELYEKNLSLDETVAYTAIFAIAVFFGGIALYGFAVGIGPTNMVSGYLEDQFTMVLKFYREVGLPEDTVDIITRSIEFIRRTLPALVISTTMLLVTAVTLLSLPLLRRKGLPCPDFKPSHWKAPEYLVWGVIVGFLLLVPSSKQANIAGENALIILRTVYFLAGVAVASFFFDKKGVFKPLRIFIYLTMLIGLIQLMVIGLGFMDTWLNFRKLKKPSAEDDSE